MHSAPSSSSNGDRPASCQRFLTTDRLAMPRRTLLASAIGSGALLIAAPAWAQVAPAGPSTLFGNLLTTLLTSVHTAIVGPIANVLAYVSGVALAAVTIYIIGYAILVMTGRLPSPAGDAVIKVIK